MLELMLTIAVLATFGLVAGGTYLIVKRRGVSKGVLMLVCAAVILGNVLILTV